MIKNNRLLYGKVSCVDDSDKIGGDRDLEELEYLPFHCHCRDDCSFTSRKAQVESGCIFIIEGCNGLSNNLGR